jgi:hypothetical protein
MNARAQPVDHAYPRWGRESARAVDAPEDRRAAMWGRRCSSGMCDPLFKNWQETPNAARRSATAGPRRGCRRRRRTDGSSEMCFGTRGSKTVAPWRSDSPREGTERCLQLVAEGAGSNGEQRRIRVANAPERIGRQLGPCSWGRMRRQGRGSAAELAERPAMSSVMSRSRRRTPWIRPCRRPGNHAMDDLAFILHPASPIECEALRVIALPARAMLRMHFRVLVVLETKGLENVDAAGRRAIRRGTRDRRVVLPVPSGRWRSCASSGMRRMVFQC